jgi:hypothetical protein
VSSPASGRLDQLRPAEERGAEARAAADDVDLGVIGELAGEPPAGGPASRSSPPTLRLPLDRLEQAFHGATGQLGGTDREGVERAQRSDVRDRPGPESRVVVAEARVVSQASASG